MTLITQQANEAVHINADWDGSEYSNTSALSEGVLLEDERTNKHNHSDLNNAATWTATTGTYHHPTIPAPDGSLTAVASNPGNSVITQSSIVADGNTMSVYARTVAGTGTTNLMVSNTHTVGLFTLTEEWQRFSLPYDVANSPATTFYAFDSGAGTLAPENILVWGPQTELGAFPSSYIPTTGTPVTRVATQMSATLADMGVPSTLVNDISLQVTFVANADGLDIAGKYLADFFSDASYANRASFIVHGSGRLQLYKAAGGLTSYCTSIANIVNGGRYVVAARFTTTTLDLWVNGVLGTKSSTGNEGDSFMFPITKAVLGTNRTATDGSFITFESCSIWPEAKSDEFMEALT